MSSAKNIETCIQCHGSSAGEVWECALSRDGVRLAFVTGLGSHAAAKQAAEYLRFGLVAEWKIVPLIDIDILDAGERAVRDWIDPGDDTREADLVACVWNATINAWAVQMLDRANT
jgi:hypothetical protein